MKVISIKVTDIPDSGYVDSFISLLSKHRAIRPIIDKVIDEHKDAIILMTIIDNMVVGILRYYKIGPDDRLYSSAPGATYINMVHVHSDWRRKGIATAMFRMIPPGKKILEVLQDNIGAISLYNSLGFTEVNKINTDANYYIMSTGESIAS